MFQLLADDDEQTKMQIAKQARVYDLKVLIEYEINNLKEVGRIKVKSMVLDEINK